VCYTIEWSNQRLTSNLNSERQKAERRKQMTMLHPKLVGSQAGDRVLVLGEPRRFLLTPEETNGTFLLFETTTQPDKGVVAHRHRAEEETFYVLAGIYDVQVGDQRTIAEAGACVFVPRGVVHAFKNIGQQVGRMLVMVSPGVDHARLFRMLDAHARAGNPPSLEETAALAYQHGWEIVSS